MANPGCQLHTSGKRERWLSPSNWTVACLWRHWLFFVVFFTSIGGPNPLWTVPSLSRRNIFSPQGQMLLVSCWYVRMIGNTFKNTVWFLSLLGGFWIGSVSKETTYHSSDFMLAKDSWAFSHTDSSCRIHVLPTLISWQLVNWALQSRLLFEACDWRPSC